MNNVEGESQSDLAHSDQAQSQLSDWETQLTAIVSRLVQPRKASSRPFTLEILKARASKNRAREVELFQAALVGLATANGDQTLSEKAINNRLLSILRLDDHLSPDGKRDYLHTRHFLWQLINSETEADLELAISFCQALSVNTMEERLDRLDLEICGAKRMADYIKNETNKVRMYVAHERRTRYRKSVQEANRDLDTAFLALEDLLFHLASRTEEETNFDEEVIQAIMSDDGGLKTLSTIKEAARAGYEYAEEFYETLPTEIQDLLKDRTDVTLDTEWDE